MRLVAAKGQGPSGYGDRYLRNKVYCPRYLANTIITFRNATLFMSLDIASKAGTGARLPGLMPRPAYAAIAFSGLKVSNSGFATDFPSVVRDNSMVSSLSPSNAGLISSAR